MDLKDLKEDSQDFLSAEELGSIFADALLEVISTVSGFSFYGIPSLPEEDSDFDDMIGIMNLTGGKNNIMFFISAREEVMRVLCSYMSGVEQSEISKEDMYDSLCEIVNMTAGNAKLRIGGTDYMFTLSVPFAIKGDNMSIIIKKRMNSFTKVLGNEEVSVKLKIVY